MMVKRIHLQNIRTASNRRRTNLRSQLIFEPADYALFSAGLTGLLWLQWIVTKG